MSPLDTLISLLYWNLMNMNVTLKDFFNRVRVAAKDSKEEDKYIYKNARQSDDFKRLEKTYKTAQLEKLILKAIRSAQVVEPPTIYEKMRNKIIDIMEKNKKWRAAGDFHTKMSKEELATSINIDLIKYKSDLLIDFLMECENEGLELWNLIMDVVIDYYDYLI